MLLTSPRPRPGTTPLYVQIRDSLVAAIEDGSLRPGDKLPSEPELSATFRVGRPTVRQALALLRQEGWIATRRGAGTFVARADRSISLLGFDGLTRSLEARGLSTSDEVLSVATATDAPLTVLSTGPALGWFVVRRVRRLSGDATPICLETDAFNLDSCPDAKALFERHRSATAVLEVASGLSIASCEVASEAVAASTEEARVLGIKTRSPLLRMERVNRTAAGEAVHLAVFLVCTDRVPVVETVINPIS